MKSVQYAKENSPGTLSNTIGWLNYDEITGNLLPNQTVSLTNYLDNGYKLNFDLTNTSNVTNVTPVSIPVDDFAPLGITGYLGLSPNNKSALAVIPKGIAPISLSNISITDKSGLPVSKYTIIAADAENTYAGINNTTPEYLYFKTNGSCWKLLDSLKAVSPISIYPIIKGLDTNFVKIIGIRVPSSAILPGAYILSTHSPTEINATLGSTFNGGRQAVAFGILIPQAIPCCTDVKVSDSNKIIYVSNGKDQFFPIKSKKSHGLVTLSYLGENFNPDKNYISGNLGIYTLLNSGILLSASCSMKPGTYDILSFKVYDSSCDYPFTLNVVFAYELCAYNK